MFISTACDVFHYNVVGEQNLPPQNISVASELFWTENEKDSGKVFDLLPNFLKNVDRGPIPGRELGAITIDKIVWTRDVHREGHSKVCLLKIPLSVPLSLPSPANICLPNIFFSISNSVAFLPFKFSDHYP